MRVKILTVLSVLLLAALPMFAEEQTRTYQFTAVGNGPQYDYNLSNVQFHQLVWHPTATLSACTIKLWYSTNSGLTWATLIDSMTCTSAGMSVPVYAVADKLYVQVSALTGGYLDVNLTSVAPVVSYPVPPGTLWNGTTEAMTATTSTSVRAAVTGSYLYVSSCTFSNSHGSTSTLMTLQTGSGGATLWSGLVPFGTNLTVQFPIPLRVGVISTGLFVVNGTNASNTYATCSGYSSAIVY